MSLWTLPIIRPEDEGCGPGDFPRASEEELEALDLWIRTGCVTTEYMEKTLGDPSVTVSPRIKP